MYRTAPRSPIETIHALDLTTASGLDAVGCLGGVAIVFAVACVVTLFMGAPPELRGWEWTLPVLAALFCVAALWRHSLRRRTLRIQRQGDEWHLEIEGILELTFPLRCFGLQEVASAGGVPLSTLLLQLVDGEGRSVFLCERRGAIDGRQEGWLETGLDSSHPGPSFDVSGAGTLADLRARVEHVNALSFPS